MVWLSYGSWFILLWCALRVIPIFSILAVSIAQAALPGGRSVNDSSRTALEFISPGEWSCLTIIKNNTAAGFSSYDLSTLWLCVFRIGFLLSSPWISKIAFRLTDLALPLVRPHGQPYRVFTGERRAHSLKGLPDNRRITLSLDMAFSFKSDCCPCW